jgi:membrane protein DedA with SNARE-associated domain
VEHFLTDVVLRYGYLAVFVLMVAESAALPVPSEVVMPLGGALASAEFVNQLGGGAEHLNLVLVALTGVLANLVGSIIAYWVGRSGGRALMERWSRTRLLRGKLHRAERWFHRRGALTVLIGRVLPVVRTFISVPAGMAEMPFPRFALYTTIGCVPWNFGLAAVGFALGSQWRTVNNFLLPVSIAVAVAVAIAVAWWLVSRVRASQG